MIDKGKAKRKMGKRRDGRVGGGDGVSGGAQEWERGREGGGRGDQEREGEGRERERGAGDKVGKKKEGEREREGEGKGVAGGGGGVWSHGDAAKRLFAHVASSFSADGEVVGGGGGGVGVDLVDEAVRRARDLLRVAQVIVC